MKYKKISLFVFLLVMFVFSLGTIDVVYSNNLKAKIKAVTIQEDNSSELFNRNRSIADVIEEVSPGIVTVSVKSVVNSYNGVNQVSGIGTGFFITSTKILTNQHVVLNSKNVKIILHDGKEIDARVINTDQVDDIALLEVTTPGFQSSTVLKLGASKKTRVGDWVIAIGSPLDLSFSGSATIGIVSGLSRTVETKNGISTFIQTDAAINPGNSGGPLLNLMGEVIGINTAKISVDGVESIGFSIPIEIAELKLEELSREVLTLGIAGVNVKDLGSSSVDTQSGVFVVEVDRDSVAYKIGIIPGDIILNFNGVRINSIEQINELKRKVNGEVSVDVLRNGKIMKFNLKL